MVVVVAVVVVGVGTSVVVGVGTSVVGVGLVMSPSGGSGTGLIMPGGCEGGEVDAMPAGTGTGGINGNGGMVDWRSQLPPQQKSWPDVCKPQE